MVPSRPTDVRSRTLLAYLVASSLGVLRRWIGGLSRGPGPLAIPISHPVRMSAACPTRSVGPGRADGMTGMALFQGLLDREGRVLDKANRLARAGFASLDANAPARAAGAFLKALGLLEAIEPTARTGDFADSFANVGTALLRVGRFESAQAAATRALSADGGNADGLGLQGGI